MEELGIQITSKREDRGTGGVKEGVGNGQSRDGEVAEGREAVILCQIE